MLAGFAPIGLQRWISTLYHKVTLAHLIVDLQVRGTDKKLALGGVPVILNVHENILNGSGNDAPARAGVRSLHCECLACTCLAICNDGCIVALQTVTCRSGDK